MKSIVLRSSEININTNTHRHLVHLNRDHLLIKYSLIWDISCLKTVYNDIIYKCKSINSRRLVMTLFNTEALVTTNAIREISLNVHNVTCLRLPTKRIMKLPSSNKQNLS